MRILAGLLLAVAASAQPVVNPGGVTNAASYATQGQNHYGIAQGSMFVVFGRGLGPAELVQARSWPLPQAEGLGGTSIRISVAGGTRDAILVYASEGQLGAILPSDTPVGEGALTVTYAGQTSEPVQVLVRNGGFGLFTWSQRGRGPAAAQNALSGGRVESNTLLAPARPGQVVVLWGTGLGPVTGNEAAGPLPGELGTGAEVYAGGRMVKPLYAGRSGCCGGIDQISFVVPDDVEGCYVPVTVQVGGKAGNFASISVARPGTSCTDTGVVNDADLELARQGQTVTSALVLLQRKTNAPATPRDSGLAWVARQSPAEFLAAEPLFPLPPVGSCTAGYSSVDGLGRQPAPPDFLPASPPGMTPLSPPLQTLIDSGASITVSGAGGTADLPRDAEGRYFAELAAPLFVPGEFRVTSLGGAVPAFEQSVSFPFLSISWGYRSAGVNSPPTVTWSGGSPASDLAVLTQYRTVTTPTPDGKAYTATGWYICTQAARTQNQSFDVPAAAFGALPLAGAGPSAGGFTVATVRRPVSARFSSPELDRGHLLYVLMDFRPLK